VEPAGAPYVAWAKGHRFEDFEPGRVFLHHWGRTLNAGDNSAFTTLTLHYNPLYFNRTYAQSRGHSDIVINPLLVFNAVFGLSVEDLSEGGGPFLGVDKLSFHHPVYLEDTLSARSAVLTRRISENRPGFGIVTWHTEGFNDRDMRVIDFERTNLVRVRDGKGEGETF
jgi:itaconyl-CoA hydratase